MDRYPGFREYVQARGAMLSRAAYRLTGDHDSARDLLVEALSVAAAGWRSDEHDPATPVRQAMAKVYGSRRWRRRQLPVEPELAELPPRQRVAAVLAGRTAALVALGEPTAPWPHPADPGPDNAGLDSAGLDSTGPDSTGLDDDVLVYPVTDAALARLRRRRRRLALGVGVVVLAVAATVAVTRPDDPPKAQPVPFVLPSTVDVPAADPPELPAAGIDRAMLVYRRCPTCRSRLLGADGRQWLLPANYTEPSLSPDGRWVAARTPEGGWLLRKLSGTGVQSLSLTAPPAWSLDDRYLAGLVNPDPRTGRAREVMVTDLTGVDPLRGQRITSAETLAVRDNPGGVILSLSFTDDPGTASDDSLALAVIDMLIGRVAERRVGSGNWLRDGEHVALDRGTFIASGDRLVLTVQLGKLPSAVLLVPLDGSVPHRIDLPLPRQPELRSELPIGYGPAGLVLAVRAGRQAQAVELLRLDVDTATVRQVARFGQPADLQSVAVRAVPH